MSAHGDSKCCGEPTKCACRASAVPERRLLPVSAPPVKTFGAAHEEDRTDDAVVIGYDSGEKVTAEDYQELFDLHTALQQKYIALLERHSESNLSSTCENTRMEQPPAKKRKMSAKSQQADLQSDVVTDLALGGDEAIPRERFPLTSKKARKDREVNKALNDLTDQVVAVIHRNARIPLTAEDFTPKVRDHFRDLILSIIDGEDDKFIDDDEEADEDDSASFCSADCEDDDDDDDYADEAVDSDAEEEEEEEADETEEEEEEESSQ